MTRSFWIAAALAASAAPALAQQLGAGGTMIGDATVIAHCAAPIGTVSLVEVKKAAVPDAALSPQLAAIMALARAQQSMFGSTEVDPLPLLKVLLARSGCFRVVDRGAGFNAVQREREIASGGQLAAGSNVGGQQLVASDYVLTAEVVMSNANAGGGGGGLGGLFGSGFGGLGGISSQTKEVQTVLTLTAVRSGIEEAVVTGEARKKDLKIAAAGLLGLGIGALGGYQNTDIGKVTAAALLDGYNKLIPLVAALPVTPVASVRGADTASPPPLSAAPR